MKKSTNVTDVSIQVLSHINPVQAEVAGLTVIGKSFVKEYYKCETDKILVDHLGPNNELINLMVSKNLKFSMAKARIPDEEKGN